MQIVIDIPNTIYQRYLKDDYDLGDADVVRQRIQQGTPLPKGHGELVDYEELKSNAREYGAYAETTLSHIKPKIIIEADKEELDANSN